MIRKWLPATLTALAAAIGSPSHAARPPYVEGQVWEYRTRAQDTGSLLKIQRISHLGPETVYHVSVIGLGMRRRDIPGVLQHAPVSRATLDDSVTSPSSRNFPTTDFEEGFAEWQRAGGGVFTIPVAKIIVLLDEQTNSMTAEP
jgi:hypothetical protein